MAANCREVLDAALQLSPEDRGMIAERLLETLSSGDADLSDDELEVELEHRLLRAFNDPSSTILWTELKAEP